MGELARQRWAPDWWQLTAVLALPLTVALVILAGRPWYPLLDQAMTELRVRAVGGGNTPLIGLPGRIGRLPEQGSHPGPLSFWMLAPMYRLAGARAVGLEFGTVVLHVAAAGGVLAIARRVAGWSGLVAAGVIVALLMRGYGTLLLVSPWNPYLPLIAWVLVIFATWAVLAGHVRCLLAVVIAGSFAAQTHVPYVVPCAGMSAIAAVAVALHAAKASPTSPPSRRECLTALGLAGAIGVLLWLPPLVEEITNGEGNISRLLDHFGSSDEEFVGFSGAVTIILRHLNLIDGFATVGDNALMYAGADAPAPRWPGVVLLVVWLGAVVVAARAGARRWIALNVTVAAGLVFAFVSTARIFGPTWYYLTLWIWALALCIALSIAGAVVLLVGQVRPRALPHVRRLAPRLGLAVIAVSTVAFTIAALDAHHPDERASDALGDVVGPVYDAIVDGVGAADGSGGRYVVRFEDAHLFGSQMFGLVNELGRRGLDVGGDPVYDVPLYGHVIDPSDATAEIRLATGMWVERWRAEPGAVEVAAVDLRTPEELRRYRDLRATLIDDLERAAYDDIDQVDGNLFILSYDRDLSVTARRIAREMLEIGTNVAVFIVRIDD